MAQTILQDSSRWKLSGDGSIEWLVEKDDSHRDHIEMSGFYISSIVHYGVENGRLNQNIHLVFPMLRTIPNNTHASLARQINYDEVNKVLVDGKEIVEYPIRFSLRGILHIDSNTDVGLNIIHDIFPSIDRPVLLDRVQVMNPTNRTIHVDLPNVDVSFITVQEKGVTGSYRIDVKTNKKGHFELAAGETIEYALIYSGQEVKSEMDHLSVDYEFNKRKNFVDETFSELIFECPDEILAESFSFAKLRAVESIYKTKGGLMHGPGGGRYYAAIWANDQAEYANPFFPFLGNPNGIESAINSFRHFARFINDAYNPIPSSIIAEGLDYWNGAGDRGDMAMIAYGAARFAMAYGDKKTAKELMPLITWCLEYCRRKLTKHGVVSSDSDELEGRFPAGDANLNTSCLYYDALISTVYLGKELNLDEDILKDYSRRSKKLKKAIEKYFGRTIAGFETYRYYNENNTLRAWICTPLTTGIFTRSEGTIEALFSDKLWTVDGLASETGSMTFWDRATLYALRGVLAAGETQRAMNFLHHYSKRRLLGEHVPYPVEAYPEGNQRHLFAESALYCRIITEGLFGIRPVGLSSFLLSPKLPDNWDSMALREIKAFQQVFDIKIKRISDKLSIKIFSGGDLVVDTVIAYDGDIKVEL